MTDQFAVELREELERHLMERDRPAGVQAAVSAVSENLLSVEALYTQVLGPLLVDTGAAWQQGVTEVWEEHFATSMVRTIVESLYLEVARESAVAPRLNKVAVLACPPEEAHDLGLRMLTDRLNVHGWDAYFLGADTPVDQIVSASRSLNADLVALSAATHYNRMLLREVIERLKEQLPGVRIGVGGPAFATDRSWPADELLSEAELGLGPGVELTGE
jgi:methanogenic corrinoid protein MtbC1